MRPQVPPVNDGFAWTEGPGGPALVCRPLERIARHLFTTRDWPLGSPQPDLASAWGDVARGLGVAPTQLARMHQVHGASVVVRPAGDEIAETSLPQADIILTDDQALAVAIQTADCVPLLIADPRTGAVAAAHAGWRGLAAGVPGVAVAALARHFGARPADLVVAVGPSISAACYEVGLEVREQFAATHADRLDEWFPKETRAGHWLFDGWRAARDQLLRSGLDDGNIHSSGLCTFTNTELCSYRRDGRGAGRMAAAIRTSRESRVASRQ